MSVYGLFLDLFLSYITTEFEKLHKIKYQKKVVK